MTIRVVVLIGVAIIFSACRHTSSNGNEVEQKLLTLEMDFLEKEFALDTAYLAYLMDSTFIDITDNGVKGKREDLIDIYQNIDQRMKAGELPDSFRLENEIVNVYSSSAVVTFIVHSYRHSVDTLTERRTRFYDIWTRRGGDWKLVASQGTVIESED